MTLGAEACPPSVTKVLRYTLRNVLGIWDIRCPRVTRGDTVHEPMSKSLNGVPGLITILSIGEEKREEGEERMQ